MNENIERMTQAYLAAAEERFPISLAVMREAGSVGWWLEFCVAPRNRGTRTRISVPVTLFHVQQMNMEPVRQHIEAFHDSLRHRSATTDPTSPVDFHWDRARSRSMSTPTNDDNQRANELLRSMLTRSQWGEYKREKTITINGNKTGQLYRLHSFHQVNIELLEPIRVGFPIRGKWACVVAAGGVPLPDQLLAQVLLIEQNEQQFLDLAIFHRGDEAEQYHFMFPPMGNVHIGVDGERRFYHMGHHRQIMPERLANEIMEAFPMWGRDTS